MQSIKKALFNAESWVTSAIQTVVVNQGISSSAPGYIKGMILFLAIFIGSSLTHWAYLRYQGDEIPRNRLVSGIILAGVAGVVTCLWLWDFLMPNRAALLAGISLTSGIGGASSIDFLSSLFRDFLKKRFGL